MAIYYDVQVHPDGKTVSGLRALTSASPAKPFQRDLDLLWIEHAVDLDLDTANAVWDLQDFGGYPGLVPPQGWDFSYIEKSSPDARAAMLALAQQALSAEALAEALSMDVSVLLAPA